jgi:hypothetical protein
MRLEKFVRSSSGRIIMSILLGFGLAAIFRPVCNGGDTCTILKAPNLEEIKDNTYKFNSKCYIFEPNAISCNRRRKTAII